jgi:hypothetical protein
MHVVLYGEAGQELRHALPASVSSATYQLLDLRKAQDDADRVLASGAATLAAWSLALDGAAGPGEANPRVIPVASTVGPSLGELAFVTAASGAFEAVTISGVVAGDSFEVDGNLAQTYAAADTVTPAEITVSIPAAVYDFEDALDDQRPLAVLWSYDIGSGKRTVLEQLRLSRTNVAATNVGEALERVRSGYPDMPGRIGPGLTLDRLADYCADKLEAELALRCEDPERLMTGRPGVWLLHDLIVAEAAQRGYAPATIMLDTFVSQTWSNYGRRLDALTVGTGGAETTKVSTETTAESTPDTSYRSPIRGW